MYVDLPIETLMTSIDGVRNMLNYCKNNSVKRFLYVSSSEVYGVKKEEQAFLENMYGNIDIDNVRASYAIGKISSELLCRSYKKEYNIDCVIVRPGHIFGPTASEKDKKVSSEFSYLAAKGENLVLKSAGLQKRSYCYSLDCAGAILVVLIKGASGESYNIGHDEITSIRDMAKYMADAGNVELSVGIPTEKELKSFNPMNNSSLNNQKIKDIGYKDTFGVKEACTHTVKILKECL
jgi:nucleoside-diphosphate-sugar epimerase